MSQRRVPTTTRPEGEHRWSMVAIADVDATTAATWAGMETLERLDGLCDLFAGPALPGGRVARVSALRGPICSECRVSWEDVHADTTRPWPCPGKRPKALGGPLVPNQHRKSRQERRAEQRKANKAVGAKRDEGSRLMTEVRAGIESSVWEHRARRQSGEAARAAAAEGMEKLSAALAGVDDLEDFLA